MRSVRERRKEGEFSHPCYHSFGISNFDQTDGRRVICGLTELRFGENVRDTLFFDLNSEIVERILQTLDVKDALQLYSWGSFSSVLFIFTSLYLGLLVGFFVTIEG